MFRYGGPHGSTSASALEANDDGILLGLLLISADADVDPDAAGGRLDVDLDASWRSLGGLLEVDLEVSRRSIWSSNFILVISINLCDYVRISIDLSES